MQQHRIVLNHRRAESPITINGSKGQLQQVFLNIIINAAEAMPHGGTLSIHSEIENDAGEERLAIYFKDTGFGHSREYSGKDLRVFSYRQT